ncbi:hypothetical protein ACG74X_16525 [Marivita sp. S0852]|uniref:hypothetical protein n=1 Tax=Marivita sp. S0852 TaxID=3373893 RepID=UPI003981CA4D
MTPVSNQTENTPLGFSALEEALLGEDAARILADTLTWVAQTRQAVRGRIDAGVSPEDHAAGTALLGALDAADTILKTPPVNKD